MQHIWSDEGSSPAGSRSSWPPRRLGRNRGGSADGRAHPGGDSADTRARGRDRGAGRTTTRRLRGCRRRRARGEDGRCPLRLTPLRRAGHGARPAGSRGGLLILDGSRAYLRRRSPRGGASRHRDGRTNSVSTPSRSPRRRWPGLELERASDRIERARGNRRREDPGRSGRRRRRPRGEQCVRPPRPRPNRSPPRRSHATGMPSPSGIGRRRRVGRALRHRDPPPRAQRLRGSEPFGRGQSGFLRDAAKRNPHPEARPCARCDLGGDGRPENAPGTSGTSPTRAPSVVLRCLSRTRLHARPLHVARRRPHRRP